MRASMALTAYITFSAFSPLTFSIESRLTTETSISPSMIRMFSSKEPNTLMVSSSRSRLMLCSVICRKSPYLLWLFRGAVSGVRCRGHLPADLLPALGGEGDLQPAVRRPGGVVGGDHPAPPPPICSFSCASRRSSSRVWAAVRSTSVWTGS